jgi:uncharacterized protein
MPFDLFFVAVFFVAVVAGAIATITGFGIGSLLTALLGLRLGTKLAVAVVSVPHLLGTALRFFTLREHVDRRVLVGFGVMSAAGGLTGALLHSLADSPILTGVFGALLVFTGLLGLSGLDKQIRFHGWTAWVAGGLSGLLGGLVGNQGGIRSAAMLGIDVPKHAFVATATAVGLIVDGARMPVYLATQGDEMLRAWPYVAVAATGVIVGTLVGKPVLNLIPESHFRRIVAAIVLALGVFMLFRAF